MESKLKVLIIEDDRYISNFIAVSLEKDNYHVLTAASASEGLFLFDSHHPDIILLDLGLPDRDGLGLIREIREYSETPVLIVSARDQESEKIEALDFGANDYITKPFHMGELMARIRVAERNLIRPAMSGTETFFRQGFLTIDYERRKVFNKEQEVHLTPIEYKLLLLLVANRGKVLTHRYILKQIWGYESQDTKNVRVFMANLRRKIEENPATPKLVLTEIGIGYRFSDD